MIYYYRSNKHKKRVIKGTVVMERKKLLKEVDSLLEYYCEGCFIKSTLHKEHSKTYAHRFCIEKCTVGEKLKSIGTLLK